MALADQAIFIDLEAAATLVVFAPGAVDLDTVMSALAGGDVPAEVSEPVEVSQAETSSSPY